MNRNQIKYLWFALVQILWVGAAFAANDNAKLRADPWVYVGKAGDCGTDPGSAIVTAGWIAGMGLPDDGVTLSASPLAARDPHAGLLLNKNGLTSNCSAAGATIKNVKGLIVTARFSVGYDYRNGGHCGAGAPRFNIDTDQGYFFVGCTNAPQVGAPQDSLEWSRTNSDVTACGSECHPSSIPVGAVINGIYIVFDEGTDTASNDTQGVGLAVIDNININGRKISFGEHIAVPHNLKPLKVPKD